MSEPTGTIHDLGYRRYDGPRLGRAYATRSLYTYSLRICYGLGRGSWAKIFPWLLVGIVGLVATVLTAARAVVGEQVVSYPEFADQVSLLLVLYAAVVAPELVSQDLRSRTLPLYFSRPLARSDYASAKLAALVTAVWLLQAGPLTLMFLGGLFSVEGSAQVREEIFAFIPALGYAAVHALLVSTIALLVASLIARRAVAAGAIVGAFVVTLPVVGLVNSVGGDTGGQIAGLFSPPTLILGLREWLFGGTDTPDPGPFGPLYGLTAVALVLFCTAGILLRYRRVQA